jgi:hypothetical protein
MWLPYDPTGIPPLNPWHGLAAQTMMMLFFPIVLWAVTRLFSKDEVLKPTDTVAGIFMGLVYVLVVPIAVCHVLLVAVPLVGVLLLLFAAFIVTTHPEILLGLGGTIIACIVTLIVYSLVDWFTTKFRRIPNTALIA